MAKRAMEPESGSDEVFDLNNDARWQVRLDEARARRAEALKKQGRADKPQRAPRKPWEDETETSRAAVEHQRPLDDDGLDFHDRMNALHKVLKATKPAAKEPKELEPKPGQNWSPNQESAPLTSRKEVKVETAPAQEPEKPKQQPGPPVDSLFDDPAFSDPLAPVVPEVSDDEALPISALVAPLPPRKPRPSTRPWLDVEDDPVVTPDVHVEEKTATKKRDGGMPFFLGVGLVALLAMPFFHWLPPLERGPDPTAAPVFGVQPAFGITAAMVEFPELTAQGDFVPVSDTPPGGPFAMVTPATPNFSRNQPGIADAPMAQTFVSPALGDEADPSIGRTARDGVSQLPGTQALQEARLGFAAGAGSIPAVLVSADIESLKPLARP